MRVRRSFRAVFYSRCIPFSPRHRAPHKVEATTRCERKVRNSDHVSFQSASKRASKAFGRWPDRRGPGRRPKRRPNPSINPIRREQGCGQSPGRSTEFRRSESAFLHGGPKNYDTAGEKKSKRRLAGSRAAHAAAARKVMIEDVSARERTTSPRVAARREPTSPPPLPPRFDP